MIGIVNVVIYILLGPFTVSTLSHLSDNHGTLEIEIQHFYDRVRSDMISKAD